MVYVHLEAIAPHHVQGATSAPKEANVPRLTTAKASFSANDACKLAHLLYNAYVHLLANKLNPMKKFVLTNKKNCV